jgi:transcriptional regulator with XRE-family HTH domain
MNHGSINDLVRERIRRLRTARGIGVTELAVRAGIPVSSYASLESGAYRITLDNLFRILGALDVGIEDVWPIESEGVRVTDENLYLKRVQEFRLSEIVSLSGAEGCALFAEQDGECSVVGASHLSDTLLDRLALYLGQGQQLGGGLWFERRYRDTRFHFFLKAESCPDFVQTIIQTYLINWSALFGSELAGK